MQHLPSIKSVQLAKALIKMGFWEHHRVGSHAQFKHKDGRRTTIPIHQGKDIPPGTLRAILKQIGISPADLINYL